ncbi:MAG: 3-deoxy-manno-octulosonate cytidylyltransferase [Phycisphaerales bacterium]|nr:3-deoxy-manno-octulosonate cytidylyltransferase [Phycisphaerales bacterium]
MTPPRVAAVIPVRMGSTRFPGKALAAETGRALVLHVADAAAAAKHVDEVLVASDHPDIEVVVTQAGVRHVMTRQDHPNGSSRVAEVAGKIDADIVVNVQGDEPELDPALIDQCIEGLIADEEASVGTLATPIANEQDEQSAHIVKVVLDEAGRALYFSRCPIPASRDGESVPRLRHIGIYAYRRASLMAYPDLPPSALERAEQLEQLRLLAHRIPITVALCEAGPEGIDTPTQYAAFVDRWRREHPD